MAHFGVASVEVSCLICRSLASLSAPFAIAKLDTFCGSTKFFGHFFQYFLSFIFIALFINYLFLSFFRVYWVIVWYF